LLRAQLSEARAKLDAARELSAPQTAPCCPMDSTDKRA
jgi:hypothetical protein